MARAKRFLIILIKPSHYDDDGYVIQWVRSPIPSNSLASVYSLIDDCRTRKILGDDAIRVNATVVRVPVFYGHSEAVNVETRDKLSAVDARKLLESAPGVEVVDEPVGGGYPTPVTHASGTDPVYVGRIRDDISHPRGLNLWIVSDNIRKGAALNAVQIAELVAAEQP